MGHARVRRVPGRRRAVRKVGEEPLRRGVYPEDCGLSLRRRRVVERAQARARLCGPERRRARRAELDEHAVGVGRLVSVVRRHGPSRIAARTHFLSSLNAVAMPVKNLIWSGPRPAFISTPNIGEASAVPCGSRSRSIGNTLSFPTNLLRESFRKPLFPGLKPASDS